MGIPREEAMGAEEGERLGCLCSNGAPAACYPSLSACERCGEQYSHIFMVGEGTATEHERCDMCFDLTLEQAQSNQEP